MIITIGVTQYDNTARFFCLLFSSLTIFSLFLMPFVFTFLLLDFPLEANSDSSWENQLFTYPSYLQRLLAIK